MIHDHHLLIYLKRSVVNLTDTDAPHILVIVDGTDQYLCAKIRISLRCRDIIQNCFKKRNHVGALYIGIHGGNSCFGGSKYEWAVQKRLVCVQIHEEFQYFVNHFGRSGLRTVNFIDTDDDRELHLESLAEDEFGLGHNAFEGVYNENGTVYHFQNPFHFSAEIRMPGGIDNIDLGILIRNGGILGQDGDAAFPLNIIGIHDPFPNLLIGTEYAALLQQFIYQGRFAVIDMGDDCYVSDIISFLNHFGNSY